MSRPSYIIALTPEGTGPAAELRLRGLLKSALRRHGLRAVLAGPVPTDTASVREAFTARLVTIAKTGTVPDALEAARLLAAAGALAEPPSQHKRGSRHR